MRSAGLNWNAFPELPLAVAALLLAAGLDIFRNRAADGKAEQTSVGIDRGCSDEALSNLEKQARLETTRRDHTIYFHEHIFWPLISLPHAP